MTLHVRLSTEMEDSKTFEEEVIGEYSLFFSVLFILCVFFGIFFGFFVSWFNLIYIALHKVSVTDVFLYRNNFRNQPNIYNSDVT